MPDRIIKESACISETLNKLTDFEERFWWRLTVNCDDYGRFDARPAVLKSRLFPLAESKTMKDMVKALNSLASAGLVEIYEVDGKPFLQVVTWEKHQRIRAKRSKFPSPDEGCRQTLSNDSKCPRNPIQSESNPNPNPNPNPNTRTRVNDDFKTFWEAYPRKEGKQKAEAAFAKVTEPVQVLLDAIEAQKKSAQWTKDGGQFIPHPATWLNGKRWLDQTIVATPVKKGVPMGASGELGEEELINIWKFSGEYERIKAYYMETYGNEEGAEKYARMEGFLKK